MRRRLTEAEKQKNLREALNTFHGIDPLKKSKPRRKNAYSTHEAVQEFHRELRKQEAQDGYEKPSSIAGYDEHSQKSRDNQDWGDTSGAVNVQSGRLDEDEAYMGEDGEGRFAVQSEGMHRILTSGGFKMSEDEGEDEDETQYSHPSGHSAAVKGGKVMLQTADGSRKVYTDEAELAEAVNKLRGRKAAESAFWSRYYGGLLD